MVFARFLLRILQTAEPIFHTAKRGGTRLLIIVLGGRSAGRRNMAARELLDAGFRHPSSAEAVRREVDGSGVMNLRHGT